eukprot:403363121
MSYSDNFQQTQPIQNQLSDLYKHANKMHYEIDAQINEVYNGKEQSSEISKVIEKIRLKIADLQSIMSTLEQYMGNFKQIANQNQGDQTLANNKAYKNFKKSQQYNDNSKRSSQSTVERRRVMEYQNEHESLDRSQNYAHEIEKQGQSIVEGLQKQSEILKKVKLRALQMLNTIGMSESIMKLIEKRNRTDILLFFGLAILTLIIIVVLFFYVKPMLFGAATPDETNVDYAIQ